MRRLALLVGVTMACALASAAGALADGPVGADPAANYPVPALGSACGDPAGAACVAEGVRDLNQARASLGQGPYLVPSNFVSLTPARQEFVLANLDRIQYGLPPITGITDALSQDAAAAIPADTDPQPTNPDFNYWTSNWAGGFENVELAYEAWMYDDGVGSGNLDCTSQDTTGCWGHRHDILWQFSGGGPLAMGAATGTDPHGSPGYAILLGEGDGNYQPSYSYTWAQAVSAGANGGNGASGAGPAPTGTTPTPSPAPKGRGKAPTGLAAKVTAVRVSVSGHTITVRVNAAAGAGVSCSLSKRGRHGFGHDRYRTCGTQIVFSGLARGRYRVRVRAAGRTLTRAVTVR